MAGEPLLIVDDNPTNLKLLRVLLVKEGYEIRTAESAEEAMSVLAGWRPRLILMDIQLPGMDGIALTRRLKGDTTTRDIVILAVTSYAMKTDQDKAMSAGCDGYVTKPVDTRALPTLIARFLTGGAQ